ncbi:SRPBCC family protein [Nonomuraea sp. NPDC048916]|uniref:SRPBCC family protein n=1 Tax=Nonomuraea sp. NPDC048916 TaxID=3154232 RepID=UPI0033C69217
MTEDSKETLGGAATALPLDRLSKECRDLAGAIGARMLGSLTGKVTGMTGRLTDYAERGGAPGSSGEETAPHPSGEEKSAEAPGEAAKGPAEGPAEGPAGKPEDGSGGSEEGPEEGTSSKPGVLGRAGRAVKGAVSRGGRPGGQSGRGRAEGDKTRVTNVVESIDIGAPIDVVYNQWTSFEDFPSFMKKVENVKQESEEQLTWKAQIFWSHRTWKSEIIEQVPDERIIWRSEGDKGYVDGAVTFHELAPNLTRVMVVLEYHPKGFFEHVGNLWRAQGRRARLEIKHFGRHVMTQAVLHPEEVKGWRGEIHDGQLVTDEGSETADAEESEGEESGGEPPEGEQPEGDVSQGDRPEGERSGESRSEAEHLEPQPH